MKTSTPIQSKNLNASAFDQTASELELKANIKSMKEYHDSLEILLNTYTVNYGLYE